MLAIETTVSNANLWNSRIHQPWRAAVPDVLLEQQSILILLGQQPHMPISEQQFLIFYKEMLASETAVSSAKLRNIHFHKPWGHSNSPCFDRTSLHLNFASTAVQYAFERTAVPHMLPRVSSSPCFHQDTTPLQTKERKTRTAVSLQFNSRKQGQHPFQSNG